jgi:hypothetical protein
MNIVERLFLKRTLGKYKFAIQENIRVKLGANTKTVTYYISIDNVHLDKWVAERLNIKHSTYKKLLLSIKGAKVIDDNVEFISADSARNAIKSILGVLYIIAQNEGIQNGEDNEAEWNKFVDRWEDTLFK